MTIYHPAARLAASAWEALICTPLITYVRGPNNVRIGLHTGEAIKESEDFFGKTVILAARIACEASGGQILVSSLLKALVESSGEFEFGEVQDVELKGLAGLHQLHQVSWAGSQ